MTDDIDAQLRRRFDDFDDWDETAKAMARDMYMSSADGKRIFKCAWQDCDAATDNPHRDGFEVFNWIPPDHKSGRICAKHANERRQLGGYAGYVERYGDPIAAGVERHKVMVATEELRQLKPTKH
jgi:hypothetical protein